MIGLDDYVLPATGTYQTDSGMVNVTNQRTILVELSDGLQQLHMKNELS